MRQGRGEGRSERERRLRACAVPLRVATPTCSEGGDTPATDDAPSDDSDLSGGLQRCARASAAAAAAGACLRPARPAGEPVRVGRHASQVAATGAHARTRHCACRSSRQHGTGPTTVSTRGHVVAGGGCERVSARVLAAAYWRRAPAARLLKRLQARSWRLGSAVLSTQAHAPRRILCTDASSSAKLCSYFTTDCQNTAHTRVPGYTRVSTSFRPWRGSGIGNVDHSTALASPSTRHLNRRSRLAANTRSCAIAM